MSSFKRSHVVVSSFLCLSVDVEVNLGKAGGGIVLVTLKDGNPRSLDFDKLTVVIC